MLDGLKEFFFKKMAAPDDVGEETDVAQHPQMEVAACALLLEIAYADDEFAESSSSITVLAHLLNQ